MPGRAMPLDNYKYWAGAVGLLLLVAVAYGILNTTFTTLAAPRSSRPFSP